MDKMAREVADSFGGIDVLCSNAGIFPSANLETMTEKDWDIVMNTNARGTLFAIQACLPYLKRAEYGRIIITSSITGPLTGYAGWAHYGASKTAQLGLMRSAALELARHNITINAVMPGNIITEGLENLGEEYLAKMAASIPLKRLGSVEDIAYAALFLSSKEAGYITGQSIIIDGGQTLPENLEAMA
jgi:3-oxoacyl-[acyl-carrier protein] reductase